MNTQNETPTQRNTEMKTATPVLDIIDSRLDQVESEVHEFNVRPNSWRGNRNTLNNHKFMNLTEATGLLDNLGRPIIRFTLVEVVRSGKKNTRIRRQLDGNTNQTELVSADSLVAVIC